MSLAPRPNTGEIARPRPDTGTARIVRPSYLLPGTESVRKEVPAWRRLFSVPQGHLGRPRHDGPAFGCGVAESQLAISIPLPWKTALCVLLIIYGRAPLARLARVSLLQGAREAADGLRAHRPRAAGPRPHLHLHLVDDPLPRVLDPTGVERVRTPRGDALDAVATTALSVAGSGTASKADLDAAFATALTQHASAAWTVARDGVVLSSRGNAPHAMPAWVEGDRFVGLVRDGDTMMLRAMARRGTAVRDRRDSLRRVAVRGPRERFGDRGEPRGPRSRPEPRAESGRRRRQASGSNTFVATPRSVRLGDRRPVHARSFPSA